MKHNFFLLLILAALLSACATEKGPQTLTVMTHDSFAISEALVLAFETEHNVDVQFIGAGDTGTAVNKAILAGDKPLADVFYGVDNTFLSRALEEGIFESYASPLLADIPDEFELDSEQRALPVDYGDVCLNYEIAYFVQNSLAPPKTLKDLLKPEYRGLVVVENPATSSPGLAFLFATVGHFGEDGYLDFWQGLVDNDVKVVNDWESAYYSEFSQWGGTYPIVVSYGSSPVFEYLFAEEPLNAPTTAAVIGAGSCFRQIEFVGILRGTVQRQLAEKWIDFMLSPEFQSDIPMQMYVFPVNANTKLDATFEQYLFTPDAPAFLAPEDISARREQWIADWTKLVLR
ncbi:MAG: thiamine ABC transporter substrate-binding protein [Chloroflexi bacterium]|jgi:thiamine transport system substrate-binding protein|nr:thiamine ABC transporter substrate-binding protein [Chloroflexota bacterium]